MARLPHTVSLLPAVFDHLSFFIKGSVYRIVKLLGEGGQGYVHLAVEDESSPTSTSSEKGLCWALKWESETTRQKPRLKKEFQMLSDPTQLAGLPHSVPLVRAFDNIPRWSCDVMVMEFLGPSVADLLEVCHGHFSLKTTLLLGMHMLRAIEEVHSRGYAHRDISPANFVLHSGGELRLIDFGLAKRVLDSDGRHIESKGPNQKLERHSDIRRTISNVPSDPNSSR